MGWRTALYWQEPWPTSGGGRRPNRSSGRSWRRLKYGGDFKTASSVASYVVILLRRSGRLEDALKVNEQAMGFDRRAGLGPWTLLGDEAQRLQLELERGKYDLVVRRGFRVARADEINARPAGPNETVNAWNVRELILDIGRSAALRLKKWQLALEFTAEISASEQARGASGHERAQTLFNDAGPLLRLRRYDEANALLLACQTEFEHEQSVEMIGKVLSTRADLEDELGHAGVAKALQEAALRFEYLEGDPQVRGSHQNLAVYLGKIGGYERQAFGHRLAAAMITDASTSGDAARMSFASRLTFELPERRAARRSRRISRPCARSSSRSRGCGLAN